MKIRKRDLESLQNVSKTQVSNSSFAGSVTILGDLLDFGQLFKAFGNN